MKRYFYILSILLVSVLGSCSKDTPFDGEQSSAVGRLYTGNLTVSLKSDEGPRSIRDRRVRQAAPNVKDFKVSFYKNGSDTPEATYLYGEMPEIVTLPVGNYVAKATYGENLSEAWNNPYYEGASVPFTITADEITEDVEPIVCRMANVCVTIAFTDQLKKAMDPDCRVSVKVGESGSLEFTVADEGRFAYFAYVSGSHTLTATFSGTVDGAFTSVTKAYDNVEPGNQYSITFRLFDAGEEDPGMIEGEGMIEIKATVVRDDMNADVDSGENVIEDDMRPSDGGVSGKDEDPDPSQPEDPDGQAPVITALPPLNLDSTNDVWKVWSDAADDYVSGLDVELNIKSEAPDGISGFKVKIISRTLDKTQLEGVGLTDEFDLINPGQFTSSLQALGFLAPGVTTLKGEKDVNLSITKFIPLLCALGDGEDHTFELTVTDAYGTTVKSLKLHTVASR